MNIWEKLNQEIDLIEDGFDLDRIVPILNTLIKTEANKHKVPPEEQVLFEESKANMNDRFKFRVWDKNNKKYGCFEHDFYVSEDGELLVNPSHGGDWSTPAGNEFKKEQCTGLKDKTGKRVYEGDIVRFSNQEVCTCGEDIVFKNLVVEYGKKSMCLILHFRKGGESYPLYIGRELIIIGNIHENSKLLED